MNKEIFKKVTLVVPTYNRYEFLYRALSYYHSFDIDLNILILDSSTKSMDKDKFKIFLNKSGIEYLKFDEVIFSNEKIAQGIKHVKTPYTIICADDDFTILSSVEGAIEFLEKNKDYSIAHGYCGQFVMDADGGKKVIKAVSSYFQNSVEENTAAGRLKNYLDNYFATIYSVHRTRDLEVNMRILCEKKFVWGFKELFLDCTSIVQGKAKRLDCFYLLREAHQLKNSKEHDEICDDFERITDFKYAQNYKDFSHYLAEKIVEADGIGMNDALEAVKQAYWAYTKRVLTKGYRKKYLKKRSVLNRIKKVLKSNPLVRRIAQRIVDLVRAQNLKKRQISLPALLNERSPYHKEFKKIYDFCCSIK